MVTKRNQRIVLGSGIVMVLLALLLGGATMVDALLSFAESLGLLLVVLAVGLLISSQGKKKK